MSRSYQLVEGRGPGADHPAGTSGPASLPTNRRERSREPAKLRPQQEGRRHRDGDVRPGARRRATADGATSEWRRLLRAAGHDVYTPTMTGVGERSHLRQRRRRPRPAHPRHRRGAALRGPARRDPRRPQLRRHGDHRRRRSRRRPDRSPRLPRCRHARRTASPSSTWRARSSRPSAQPARSSTASSWSCCRRPDAGLLYGVTDPDDMAWMAERLTGHPWKCFEQPLELTNEAALLRDPAVPHRLHLDAGEPRSRARWRRRAPKAGSGTSTPATT